MNSVERILGKIIMMLKDSIKTINEYQRAKKLNDLDLDYANLQDEFERLVKLAKYITDTDISYVNLIDNYSQWTITSSVSGPFQVDREDSICQFTIQGEGIQELPILDQDKRFSDNPFVKRDKLKYYLGIPLKVSTGENIGALCVLDQSEKNISLEKKRLLQLIADEIVEKLEHKKKLDQLEDQLASAIKERYQMAHDIRSPLGGILGLTSTIEEENMDADESKAYFKLINSSVSKLMELTDDILEKRQKLGDKNQFDLSSLKAHLEELYFIPASNKDIALDVSFDKTKNQYKFSRRKLLPIIGNLIANAIKFTPSKGSVAVKLDIMEMDKRVFLTVKVSDNGIGMSKEKLKELTNDALGLNPGTNGEKGYGLGLQLVAEMVNSIDGKLNVVSEKDKGTTMDVTVPI